MTRKGTMRDRSAESDRDALRGAHLRLFAGSGGRNTYGWIRVRGATLIPMPEEEPSLEQRRFQGAPKMRHRFLVFHRIAITLC